MNRTKIEWCDMTINPIVGCSKCSPGCDNCYAERIAARMANHPNPKVSGKYAGVVDDRGKWTGKMNVDLSCLRKFPKEPSRIFVGSMCDLFHERATRLVIAEFLDVVASHPQHIFMLLTKRPARMRDEIVFYTEGLLPPRCPVLPNLWLGATVCNQAEADEKIPLLLQVPAAKRFVSIEPMLGAVDLTSIKHREEDAEWRVNCLTAEAWCDNSTSASAYCDSADGVEKLDWVICGGETGPKARPMHPDWVRSLRTQCVAAGVPFFFKSWGEWEEFYDRDRDDPDWREVPSIGSHRNERFVNLDGRHGFHGKRVLAMRRVGKRRSGRLLDGCEWNEVPR